MKTKTLREKAAERRVKFHPLAFSNAKVYKGLNVSIRNGTKWNEKAEMGDELLCVDLGGTPIKRVNGGAQIKSTKIISTEVFDYETYRSRIAWMISNFDHARPTTLTTIEKTLDEVYDEDWGPEVTLVVFWIETE